MLIQNRLNLYLTLAAAALLSACGGGGGSSDSAPANTQAAATTPTPAVTPTPGITGTPPTVTQSGSTTVAPSVGSTVSAATSCDLPNFQADMLIAINAARAQARSCGQEAKPAVAAVAWNNALFAAAAGHSQDMATRNYFSHTTPDGVSIGPRATAAGYSWGALGENIAAGQIGIASVMASWLGSEGHCKGIMSSLFTQVAVACVKSTTADQPTYWTMELGKPR